MPGWLLNYFAAIVNLFVNGNQQPQARGLDLVAGTNVTITNVTDAVNGINHVTIASSGSGSGGWTYTAASSGSLTAATWQFIAITGGGGTFNLPTSGMSAGQRIDFKDAFATSAGTGIAASPVTISGGSKYVQDPHTMVTSNTSYTFGGTSGDSGGSTLSLMYNGTGWMVIE